MNTPRYVPRTALAALMAPPEDGGRAEARAERLGLIYERRDPTRRPQRLAVPTPWREMAAEAKSSRGGR